VPKQLKPPPKPKHKAAKPKPTAPKAAALKPVAPKPAPKKTAPTAKKPVNGKPHTNGVKSKVAKPHTNGKPKLKTALANLLKSKPKPKPKKPKKPHGPTAGMLPLDGMPLPQLPEPPEPPEQPGPGTIPIPGGAGGASATPQITAPLANANVVAGADLTVDVNTNRADLRYILEVRDVTPPSSPPGPMPAPIALAAPVMFNATPTGNDFSFNVPGNNLSANRNYRLRVFVDPLDGFTPPHADFPLPVNT
jgi:hypothetical protein